MEWTSIIDCAYDAEITVADESADAIAVTIQLKDFEGKNLDVASCIRAYCASDSAGLTYAVNDCDTDFTASVGTIAVLVTKGIYQLVSTAAGLITISCGDTAANTAFYLVLVMPNGKIVVSDQILLA